MKVQVCVVAIALSVLLSACTSSPIAPTGPQSPLGPPQVFKDPITGLYHQNPAVTLPPGVTIDPITGGLIYPVPFPPVI